MTRVGVGLATFSLSELAQKKPFQQWKKSEGAGSLGDFGKFGVDPFHGLAKGVGRLAKKPSHNPLTPDTFMADAERQRLATAAAARRRKEFQNMGRSSTILTGPGGLGGVGAGEQKTLLGM